jgi:hypothetical protein
MLHWRKLAAALFAALTIGAALAAAQTPAPAMPRKVYTNKTAFKLPLQVDERERGWLQTIQLYVKTNPAEPWALRDSISPSQREFVYRVPQDGEYWFTLVTVDKNGKPSPADINAEPPGLIVVVDRQAPEVDVHPVALGAGMSCLLCEVRDANPDPARTRLEFQAPDHSWQPLEPVADQPGCFRVPEPSVLRGVVRATAADRAGNVTMREVNLQTGAGPSLVEAGAVQPATLEVQASPAQPRPTTLPPEVHSAPAAPAAAPAVPTPTPAAPAPAESKATAGTADPKPAPPAPVEVRAEKVAAPSPASAAGPVRQFVNSTHVTLKYQIDQLGPSGLGRVEVWMTRDDGQNWTRLCEDSKRQSPVEIDLPGEGSFGVSVVVANGNGQGGEPPVKGDVPDWKLEVDTTKPAVQVFTARAGTGPEAGTLGITWTANDKNLKPEPIDLLYANRPEGPWQTIARGLKNDGSYRWPLPKDSADDFYVRMEVTDLAGNSTVVQTPQPIVVDRTRPKAKVVGVVAGAVTGER